MALTTFQRDLCRCIAANRMEQGESYLAGGAALNLVTGAARVSRDLDLFHDTDEALEVTWRADSNLLQQAGYRVEVVRERPSYVEAMVAKGGDCVLVQWLRDSAFRFFPLVQHEEAGLVLHPFDLATNKTLALVGRLEIRDWIDLITCHQRIQPLGYLAWAACGKDAAFSPVSIIEQAARAGRYTTVEMRELQFDGPAPDLAALSRNWREILEESRQIIALLPGGHAGKSVLHKTGDLYAGSPEQLQRDLAAGGIVFHSGRIRGAFPEIVPRPSP